VDPAHEGVDEDVDDSLAELVTNERADRAIEERRASGGTRCEEIDGGASGTEDAKHAHHLVGSKVA
jgi:hypothetical protein